MYIPRSNIIEIGYANEGKFLKTKYTDPSLQPNLSLTVKPSLKDNTPYEGYYHKDKQGNYWVGREHTDTSVILLSIDQISLPIDAENTYTKLQPKIFPTISITPDFIYPTQDEYNKGHFSRFIIKHVISSQINDFFEVKKEKFQQIIQNSDLLLLYKPVTLIWKLTGPLYDEYQNNIRTRSGIIDTNKRSLQEAETILPNVSLYFTDLIQFGKPS
jgi:hypothetical protein